MAKNMPSAQDAAAKWAQNFGAAGPAWAQGINSVTVAPGQLAAAAQDRYLAGVQQSVGKYAANVARVSLQEWQAVSVQKGQARLAAGAQAALQKYTTQIGRVMDTAKSVIASLPPRGDVMQNIERSRQFQLGMHQAFQK